MLQASVKDETVKQKTTKKSDEIDKNGENSKE